MATIAGAIPVIRTSLQQSMQRLCNNPELFQYRRFVIVKFGLISMMVTLAFIMTAAWLQLSLQVPPAYTICWIPLAACLLLVCAVASSKLPELLFIGRSKSSLRNVSFTFLGGFLGVIGVTGILSATFHIPFVRVCDASLLSWPFFHALSRIACINYGCCHGKPLPDASRFGLVYHHETSKAVRMSNLRGVLLYPSQVYEMLGCVAVGVIGLLVFWFSDHHGYVTGAYCISYGLLRQFLQRYRYEALTKRKFFRILSYQKLLTVVLCMFGLYVIVIAAIQGVVIESNFDLSRLPELIWILPSAGVASMLVFLGHGVHYNKVGQWF